VHSAPNPPQIPVPQKLKQLSSVVQAAPLSPQNRSGAQAPVKVVGTLLIVLDAHVQVSPTTEHGPPGVSEIAFTYEIVTTARMDSALFREREEDMFLGRFCLSVKLLVFFLVLISDEI